MPSNIVFNASVGVEINNCTFRHMGAGALQFRGGAHNNVSCGCGCVVLMKGIESAIKASAEEKAKLTRQTPFLRTDGHKLSFFRYQWDLCPDRRLQHVQRDRREQAGDWKRRRGQRN